MIFLAVVILILLLVTVSLLRCIRNLQDKIDRLELNAMRKSFWSNDQQPVINPTVTYTVTSGGGGNYSLPTTYGPNGVTANYTLSENGRNDIRKDDSPPTEEIPIILEELLNEKEVDCSACGDRINESESTYIEMELPIDKNKSIPVVVYLCESCVEFA